MSQPVHLNCESCLLLRLLQSADVGGKKLTNKKVCYWILRLARTRLSFA